MEENELKPSEQVVEQKPKKKGNGVVIFLLILIILSLAGYICYDKFLKKESKKQNSNEVVTEDIYDKYTLSDVEDVFAGKKDYFAYYKYKTLKEEYLEMLPKDALPKKIDILDALQSVMKVENGKLYWYKNNNWVLDDTIKSEIKYLISDFSVLHSYRGVIVATEDKLYIIDENVERYDGIPDDEAAYNWAKGWDNNITYNIIELPGKLQDMQVKTASACEGWNIFQIKIDDKIYYLSNEDKFIPAKEYISNFESVIGGCGQGSPKGILVDGTLLNAVSSNNKKINIDLYIVFPRNDSGYADVVLIDENKNLYMFNEEIFEGDNPVKLKPIQKIKDYKFGEDPKGEYEITNWVRLTLSNNKTIEVHD